MQKAKRSSSVFWKASVDRPRLSEQLSDYCWKAIVEATMNSIKYVHTNLVAKDWKSLAQFYIKVFGCKRKPPERNLSGKWLDTLTATKKANVKGIHLQLPGYGQKGGPTLEVFQYSTQKGSSLQKVNKPGFGHIAFAVSNVKSTLEKVKKFGGSSVGDLVETTIKGVGRLEVVYARDPEGNIVEIQKWE
jgi:lactoylglutathione lyase